MNENRTVEINQKYQPYKRSCESDSNSSSKRSKSDTDEFDEHCDSSTSDTDNELICLTDDTEDSPNDDSDTEDFEDDSNLATDQSRYYPVVINQNRTFSKRSKELIRQFKSVHESNRRKPIETTQSIDDDRNQIKKLKWELKNTFNRNELLKEGYAVLSDTSFPFYSLCYMVSKGLLQFYM